MQFLPGGEPPVIDQEAIRSTGLGKTFDALKAVDGVDLLVRKGEMFALVGPDGAGKTTTVRMLCGILTPTSGNASILGFDIAGDKKHVKQKIGYLSQRFSLYGDLSIDENIEFFAEVHGVSGFRERREELLGFTFRVPVTFTPEALRISFALFSSEAASWTTRFTRSPNV